MLSLVNGAFYLKCAWGYCVRINWCMFDFGPRTHAPLLSWQQRPLSHQWYKMVVTTRSYTGSGTRRTSSKSLGHNICMVFCLLKRGKQIQHNGRQLKVPCLFLTLWTAWAMGCVIPRILTQLWTSLRLPLAIELCQRTAPRKQDRSHKSRRTLWRSTFQIAINLLKFYFVETFMFYVCVSCFLSKWLLIYFSSHCQFIYVCISNKLIGRWRWTM